MARHKDENWNLVSEGTLNQNGSRSYPSSTTELALLMDIRDELKLLNKSLAVQVDLLQSIRRNTAWSRAKRKS